MKSGANSFSQIPSRIEVDISRAYVLLHIPCCAARGERSRPCSFPDFGRARTHDSRWKFRVRGLFPPFEGFACAYADNANRATGQVGMQQ